MRRRRRQTHKYCKGCREYLPLSCFYWKKGKRGTILFTLCKDCELNRNTNNRRKRKKWDYRYVILGCSITRAHKKKWRHNLKITDIPQPTHCLYLGIPLNYKKCGTPGHYEWNRPSLDRIDSTGGYTRDNIQVISRLANNMKSNATPQQLLAFAHGILKLNLLGKLFPTKAQPKKTVYRKPIRRLNPKRRFRR